MPEQLTKHPEVTLQVLRSAGARCGDGASQSILTQCPPQRFCKLPGGEVCIYGLTDAPGMTQISASDWQVVQQALHPGLQSPEGILHGESLLVGGVGILFGAVFGMIAMHLKRR
jgi:hypothetical protein